MNTSQMVREFELGMIDSITSLVDRITEGGYSGRLYSKLIDGDPINSALACIKEFHAANNSVMDVSVVKKIENEETRLVKFLLKNKEDPEVKQVIEQILKANNYGISTIKKINDAFNMQSASSLKISDLPSDVLKYTFLKCEAKDMVNISRISKKFNDFKFTDEEDIWRLFSLKEGEADKDKFATWKEFYINITEINSYRGNDCLKMLFSDKAKSLINKADTCLYVNAEKILYVNTEKITVNKIKKLIKKDLNLNCDVSQMKLITAGKILEDPLKISAWRELVCANHAFTLFIEEDSEVKVPLLDDDNSPRPCGGCQIL